MELPRFPGMRYGPNGEVQRFESAEDVPPGWVDRPWKLKPADVVAAVADMASQIAKFDHDGDGRPGGSKPRKKAVKRDSR